MFTSSTSQHENQQVNNDNQQVHQQIIQQVHQKNCPPMRKDSKRKQSGCEEPRRNSKCVQMGIIHPSTRSSRRLFSEVSASNLLTTSESSSLWMSAEPHLELEVGVDHMSHQPIDTEQFQQPLDFPD